VEKLLITGAAGLIGTILAERLADEYAIRGVDRRGRGAGRVDLRRTRSVARAIGDAQCVVHLAEVASLDSDWRTVWQNNVRGTMHLLEAAQAAGVRRFVYASSNHVTGGYEQDEPYASIVRGAYDGLRPEDIPLLDARSPVRPDSPYAVGKTFGEAAVRYYADIHGLSAVCLRIGTVLPANRPTQARHYATLLTHDDLVRLVKAALAAPPDVRFAIAYGVSANTWRFWDVADDGSAIRYEPQDDAELFRGEDE
jgi:nucleoside-diphosphate-sugar epimerase